MWTGPQIVVQHLREIQSNIMWSHSTVENQSLKAKSDYRQCMYMYARSVINMIQFDFAFPCGSNSVTSDTA